MTIVWKYADQYMYIENIHRIEYDYNEETKLHYIVFYRSIGERESEFFRKRVGNFKEASYIMDRILEDPNPIKNIATAMAKFDSEVCKFKI